MTFLETWPLDRLEALYRAYKRTGFFRHPRDVIYLREVVQRKRKAHQHARNYGASERRAQLAA